MASILSFTKGADNVGAFMVLSIFIINHLSYIQSSTLPFAEFTLEPDIAKPFVTVAPVQMSFN